MSISYVEQCYNCGNKNEDELDFCSNRKCGNCICYDCILESQSGDTICIECSENCHSCNEILNISVKNDNDDYIIIDCKKCSNNRLYYCMNCVKKYHIQNCNNRCCHNCMPKCSECDKLCCYDSKYHLTYYLDGMCKHCFQNKYFEIKKDRMYLFLEHYTTFSYNLIDIIISYYM